MPMGRKLRRIMLLITSGGENFKYVFVLIDAMPAPGSLVCFVVIQTPGNVATKVRSTIDGSQARLRVPIPFSISSSRNLIVFNCYQYQTQRRIG